MATMRALLVRVSRHARITTHPQLVQRQSIVCATHWLGATRSCSARGFSSKGVNGVNGVSGLHDDHGDDEWDDVLPLDRKVNGERSPFERLLEHSQQFHDEVDLDDQPEDGDAAPPPLSDDERHQDDAGDQDSHDDRHEARGIDLEDALDERKDGHDEFMGQIRKPHGHHSSSHGHGREEQRPRRKNRSMKRWGIEQRVRRQIGGAEDVDFEHGLRDLDERRAREKMYVQLLAREYDRDRVCQNCGERGHVAANCMLPVICSNCGDVGHRRGECPHHFHSSEQLAAIKPIKQVGGPKKSQEVLRGEQRRRVELQAIRERHDRMKHAFDEELEEYLIKYESFKKNYDARVQKTTKDEV